MRDYRIKVFYLAYGKYLKGLNLTKCLFFQSNILNVAFEKDLMINTARLAMIEVWILIVFPMGYS